MMPFRIIHEDNLMQLATSIISEIMCVGASTVSPAVVTIISLAHVLSLKMFQFPLLDKHPSAVFHI